ncbi:rhomboid family intramembrane serine protease [Bernardetia sp.]|uniref:rhomboid family intramembrane serine protease n=1 Tax=Bernardetia sp. TaxID=1937974 RepID=UPI0025BD01DD|nr:rhomboid family intramembrane serine protease [Bernardetia sp.]
MDFSERIKYEWNKSDNTLMRVIMINVAVYLLLATVIIIAKFGGVPILGDITAKVFFLPADISDLAFRPWTLLTYGFAHSIGDIFHIVFNMLVLFWFGQIVVSEIGSNRFLGLYIWGILAGAVAFLLLFNFVPYFTDLKNGTVLIGASAGVYAVVVAAGTLLPNVKMNLFLLGEVSLKWIAMGYIILSFVSLAGGNAGGNMAHLGGALIGYLFIVQYRKGNDWSKPIVGVTSFFANLFKRKPKMKAYKGGASSYKADDSNRQKQARAKKSTEEQNQIDEILDKISASGYESLTQKEKQILFQASKK